MRTIFYRTCLVDGRLADMYIHYLKTQELKYYVEQNPETGQAHIEVWGTQVELDLFKRWILKTLYDPEVRNG